MCAFELHPRLAAGGIELGRTAGCRVLLKNNAHFPWLILVPEVAESIEDLHQLDEPRFEEVTRLVREVSQWMEDYFRPTKLNVACIGNQVRQMHLHVVARREDDPAWPGTVWACDEKKAYTDEEIATISAAFSERFPIA